MAPKKPAAKNKIDSFAKAVGLGIVLKRDLLGMMQKVLAQKANISVRHLRAIEQGKALPSMPEYIAIKKALKVPSAKKLFGKK